MTTKNKNKKRKLEIGYDIELVTTTSFKSRILNLLLNPFRYLINGNMKL